MKIAVAPLLSMLVLSGIALGQSDIDFKRTTKASEVAKYFFGPEKPHRVKKAKINIGRIGISAKTKLNCGRIDAVASINAELNNLERQLRSMASQIGRMYSNPSALAMALICYYKPQVCSYIRHSSLMFNEQLALNFDACQALDEFIDNQADKGMKRLQAESVQKCIMDRSRGGGITTKMVRDCQRREGRMRNLLQPFRRVYATRKQKVLKSIVDVVQQGAEYPLLARMLGEVEVHENGHWVKMFPQDMLRPGDVSNNYIASAEKEACDTTTLAKIVDGSLAVGSDPFDKEIRTVIREKVPKEAVRDLRSLPRDDQKRACTSLAEGVAEIAVKRTTARNKSVMAAALANDALPDDLRAFYRERSKLTFDAIYAKIEAQEIKPLGQVLSSLRSLALQFRARNREAASQVSAGKILNDKSAPKECEDELSCER